MDYEANNIIAIRKRDISLAHEAFASLMGKTEQMMNEDARTTPGRYRDISPSALEQCSVDKVKEACGNTPFNPDEIFLISGHKFPDILAEKYYGIEVKSTVSDSWTSTGSSIVETTRIKDVEDIYMLFGKLGGDIPQFKCRPYQDVLYDIAVTHSPRYLINMELNKNETIFSKMGTEYDTFRKSDDNILQVRRYYREEAIKSGKMEMPWWITSENIDQGQPFNIRLWTTLDAEAKKDIRAKCMVLFPESLDPKGRAKKYNNTSLWLCSYYQVVNPNIRDLYSAGGKITKVNGKPMATPVARVFSTIVEYADRIKALLLHPTKEMLDLIAEYNPRILRGNDCYEGWLDMCCEIADRNNVPLKEWIAERPTFQYSKK